MSEPTRDEAAAADALADRRRRARILLRKIRAAVSQMARPKCKQHIKVRRLQQIAGAIDSLGDLGFDDLGDGALIGALTDALKEETKAKRRAGIHAVGEALDLFAAQLGAG